VCGGSVVVWWLGLRWVRGRDLLLCSGSWLGCHHTEELSRRTEEVGDCGSRRCGSIGESGGSIETCLI